MEEECARYHARLAELLAIKTRDLQYDGVMDPGKSLVCSTEGGGVGGH